CAGSCPGAILPHQPNGGAWTELIPTSWRVIPRRSVGVPASAGRSLLTRSNPGGGLPPKGATSTGGTPTPEGGTPTRGAPTGGIPTRAAPTLLRNTAEYEPPGRYS